MLRATAAALKLDVDFVRKERGVGIVKRGGSRFAYAALEEITLELQDALEDSCVPHCAFNGGSDVFCDVGEFGCARACGCHV